MTFLRFLHRCFSTFRYSQLPARPRPVETQIYNEHNLTLLVKDFKNYSRLDWFRSNTNLYEMTVSRLAAAKRFGWIEEILEHQKQFRDICKEGFAVRLITLYGKSGMFEHAYRTFDEMPERECERTVMSFNAILLACVNSKQFNKLKELFRELPSKLSIAPNKVSYGILIKGFCRMGSFDSAISLLDEMGSHQIKPDLLTFNTLLFHLYKSGHFSDGEKIWNLMEGAGIVPDTKIFHWKLVGLSVEKKMSEAERVVEEMWSKGIKPSLDTFLILVRGSCDAGDLEGAKKWYDRMAPRGLTPRKAFFLTLIPAAMEKGDHELVLGLCKDIFQYQCRVGTSLFQGVIDWLIKESKVEEAEKLLDSLNSCDFCHYSVKAPLIH